MLDRSFHLTAAAVLGVAALLACGACTRPSGADGAASGASASGPVTADGANVEDTDVTTNVKTALLADADLKAFDIAVATTKGDVRLSGRVDNQAQADAAVKLARATAGVHSIHDELTVKP